MTHWGAPAFARHLRLGLLAVLALVAIVTLAFLPPIPQDPAYHAFADARTLLGLPNFWNVVSNAPFLLVGGWGLRILLVSGHSLKHLAAAMALAAVADLLRRRKLLN